MSSLPQLDEELTEFLQYIALHESKSLRKVDYSKLCRIFKQDYSLNTGRHDEQFN